MKRSAAFSVTSSQIPALVGRAARMNRSPISVPTSAGRTRGSGTETAPATRGSAPNAGGATGRTEGSDIADIAARRSRARVPVEFDPGG